MEHALQTFTHPEFGRVKIQLDNIGLPWWLAPDVCLSLRFPSVVDTLSWLVKDVETGVITAYTRKGPLESHALTEAGLYSLLAMVDYPTNYHYLRWHTQEILPLIESIGEIPPSQIAEDIFEGQPSYKLLAKNLNELKQLQIKNIRLKYSNNALRAHNLLLDIIDAQQKKILAHQAAVRKSGLPGYTYRIVH